MGLGDRVWLGLAVVRSLWDTRGQGEVRLIRSVQLVTWGLRRPSGEVWRLALPVPPHLGCGL